MVLERPMSHCSIAKGKEDHSVETMVFFCVCLGIPSPIISGLQTIRGFCKVMVVLVLILLFTWFRFRATAEITFSAFVISAMVAVVLAQPQEGF